MSGENYFNQVMVSSIPVAYSVVAESGRKRCIIHWFDENHIKMVSLSQVIMAIDQAERKERLDDWRFYDGGVCGSYAKSKNLKRLKVVFLARSAMPQVSILAEDVPCRSAVVPQMFAALSKQLKGADMKRIHSFGLFNGKFYPQT